jgi:hypothetical protein
MNKKQIKKMNESLQIFFKTNSLIGMSKNELSYLPKELIIGCASQQIPYVWSKLSTKLQEDSDITKYLFCTEHYQTAESNDVNDGPAPRRIFCCYCNIKDNQFTSKK